MQLTVLNLTPESLSFRVVVHSKPKDQEPSQFTVVEPSSATTTTLPKRGKLALLPLPSSASPETELKEWTIHPNGPLIQLSLVFGASWRAIPVPDWCPWRIFLTKVRKTKACK